MRGEIQTETEAAKGLRLETETRLCLAYPNHFRIHPTHKEADKDRELYACKLFLQKGQKNTGACANRPRRKERKGERTLALNDEAEISGGGGRGQGLIVAFQPL